MRRARSPLFVQQRRMLRSLARSLSDRRADVRFRLLRRPPLLHFGVRQRLKFEELLRRPDWRRVQQALPLSPLLSGVLGEAGRMATRIKCRSELKEGEGERTRAYIAGRSDAVRSQPEGARVPDQRRGAQ